MLRELGWKRNFGKTIDRFEAWWAGEMIDRPPVTLQVKPTRGYAGPTKSHAAIRDRWLDVEYVVERAAAELERREWVGDAFPLFNPNVGPEVTATLLGCELEFSEDSSWSTPVVREAADWERIIAMEADFDNPYWRTIERMTDYAIDVSGGRFMVGMSDLHGNYDILGALRDPQALCLDLMDCPQLVRRAGRKAAAVYNEAFRRSYAKVSGAGMGSTCWTPFVHDGPAYVPSSDFWCMVSREMAREMVLPDIVTEMEGLQRSVFHLDGLTALQHLDLLLEMPRLNAVQWVFGAGHGPAARWIEVYRRILAAGKGVQVLAADAADAMRVLEEIGCRGVWVCVGEAFDTAGEAESFLRRVERMACG